MSFYRNLLEQNFADDDKIICINCGSPAWVERELGSISHTLSLTRAPSELSLDSDASGYQTCLKVALDRLEKYDAVLFMHSKGASYDWERSQSIRVALCRTIFDRHKLQAAFAAEGSQLVADRGHLPQTPRSWDEVAHAARLLGLPEHIFCFAATFSLFAVTAKCLRNVLVNSPSAFTDRNLGDIGFNRYFFEAAFPSLLAHKVDHIKFLGGTEYDTTLSRSVSVDAFPLHNSMMVLREFQRYREGPNTFIPKAFPYVFGPASIIAQIKVQFDV